MGRAMIRRTWAVTLVGVLTLTACAVQPGEVNLRTSFAEQIASADGVLDFERTGDELTFSGPDGRGGTAGWRVRIDSAVLEPGPDEQVPYQGHIVSSWYRDGELIQQLGSMSGLPDAFLNPPVGVAQECWAFWDTTSNAWDW